MAKRNGALQTRDRYKHRVRDDPETVAHRFTLRRIRETKHSEARADFLLDFLLVRTRRYGAELQQTQPGLSASEIQGNREVDAGFRFTQSGLRAQSSA